MLNLRIPLQDDYGKTLINNQADIERADNAELLNLLKGYVSDERFNKELKQLMSNAVWRDWNNLVLQERLKEQEEEA
jgi:hypothetical protein